MKRFALLAALASLGFGAAGRIDGPVIATLDDPVFQSPAKKAAQEMVPGKEGRAVRFTFEEGAQSTFFTSRLRGTPEWDRAGGISFWVKGDGSENFGGLQLIFADDYAVRYDVAFPLKGTEWTKVTVPWRDFIPSLPGPKSKPLDPIKGNKPSEVSSLWVGKWWYWRDYPAHSFAMDDLRLEPAIPLDTRDYRPAGAPLERVLNKLKQGKPITIVTMGDSLTDFRHWANREVSWNRMLQKSLKEKYGSEVTLVNPAIGGTQLRQNLVLMPLWLAKTPEPDLVTVCFGGNDWDAGMRGPEFTEACRDAIDRIRRATHGKSDVLLMSTLPTVERWTAAAELQEACRVAAKERNAGLADTAKAFELAGRENKERLFGFDKVHMSPIGHEIMATTVLNAITGK